MSIFFPPREAPPAKDEHKHKWFRRMFAVLTVLLVVALASAAIYVGSVSRSFTNNVVRQDLLPTTTRPSTGVDESATEDRTARPAQEQGAVNYVLMGSDSRFAADAGAGRSDTLMVVHLAADRKSAYLISFPRDMYVQIPGYGKNKINAAFAFGGPQLTVRTLESLLDIKLTHAALVDFNGFTSLTEELGGVTVINRHKSSSRGYDFPAGEITVRGDQALAYVRERYALPEGDLDRAERQRDVVKAILSKGLSLNTIRNPAKFTGFVSGVAQHLTVDSSMSNADIRSTGLSLRLSGSDVQSLQAPISGFATMGGQSVDVVDDKQLKELSRALVADQMAEYAASHPPR